MKKHILFSGLLACLAAQSAFAQDLVPSDSLKTLMKLDFQVPDNPAFKALGIDPSDVLRPGEVKEFALTVAPFFGLEGASLPKNFAMEFSPGRIASKNWSLHQYRNSCWKRFWANTAFSAATRFDEDQAVERPFGVGLGLRTSLLARKGDPVRDTTIINEFKKSTQYYNRSVVVYVNEVMHSTDPVPMRQRKIQTPQSDEEEELRAAYLKWLDSPAAQTRLGDTARYSFAGRVENFKRDYWNAGRFDIGLAWSGQAIDTTLAGLGTSNAHVWLARSFRLGRGGQLLFGGTYMYALDPDSAMLENQFAVNLRGYYGREGIRGFVEAQYRAAQVKDVENGQQGTLLVNLGVEARLNGRLWILASTGLENYLDAEPDVYSALRSNLDLRYYLR
jgi:hypothetical protein